jgi:hypothetical protein
MMKGLWNFSELLLETGRSAARRWDYKLLINITLSNGWL